MSTLGFSPFSEEPAPVGGTTTKKHSAKQEDTSQAAQLVKILDLLEQGGAPVKQVVYDYLRSSFVEQKAKQNGVFKQLSEPGVMMIVCGVACMLMMQFSIAMMRMAR